MKNWKSSKLIPMISIFSCWVVGCATRGTRSGSYFKCYSSQGWVRVDTLRLRQNGCHFADDTFKCIFLNKNMWISTKISVKFVPEGPINNIPAVVQIMAWRLPGDKPLSEPMRVRLPTHICVTRPQWVNKNVNNFNGIYYFITRFILLLSFLKSTKLMYMSMA